jgi:hypothetical protein
MIGVLRLKKVEAPLLPNFTTSVRLSYFYGAGLLYWRRSISLIFAFLLFLTPAARVC